ncbi:MAG: MlaD family protein [Oligoflexus sp.]
MRKLSTEFKVGLFTLVGIAATVFSIFILSPGLFDREKRIRYFTILDDASGILEKTHVRTNGVTIGRVLSVSLHERATKVRFEIRSDVAIPEGSKVVVRTVGFLGDRFIEIQRHQKSTEIIEEGGFIPQARDPGDINEVIAVLGSIGQDIKKVTENLAAVLGDEQGRESMANMVKNIEDFTNDARGMLRENREDVQTMVTNLREFSQTLNDVLDGENRERLERILTNFDSSMEEVKGATKNINLISEKVERGEGTLGKLINEDETLVELESAIRDIREVLAPATRLQIGVETHAEIRRDESSQAYFNLKLQTRPDLFYLIGFTDVSERIRDTTTETIATDPVTNETRIRERIRDEKSLRFNLQVAKRWNWIGARMGLFESKGGVAADVYMFRSRLRLSVEAFDFAGQNDDDVRRTAHLKVYASALFFNHIFTIIGIDDPTRIDPATGRVNKELNAYVGAGLNFTDQDLKSLFGIAAVAIGN